MTKKIEVEVKFAGGDFYIYEFYSEILAAGFAKDVFKNGATFIRDNAYHTYGSSSVICTKVRMHDAIQTTEASKAKRKDTRQGNRSRSSKPSKDRTPVAKD